MSLFDPVRNYCERSGDGLWDEPLNALSNIAFFIAAWLLYTGYRRHGVKDRPVFILIALVAVVGLGSTLFHTFANGLTMLFDIIPIAAFTFYYLWVALRRLVALSRRNALVALAGFAVAAAQMRHLPADYRFNGSADYFPCLAALVIIAVALRARAHPSSHMIWRAAGLFALSLTCRSVDFMLCPGFALGTHFLWHGINGLMLFYLVKAVTLR